MKLYHLVYYLQQVSYEKINAFFNIISSKGSKA